MENPPSFKKFPRPPGKPGIANIPDFNRLITTLALRTGQMLNLSELSRDTGIPFTTLRRYVNILMQTYQILTLPPYKANIAKRLVKTPKVYFTDTGMACHYGAIDDWDTLIRQNRSGAMLETWVMNEFRKWISVSSWRTDIYYLRTRTGMEVDFILERGGQLVGVEVKWSAGFNRKDLTALQTCRDMFPDRWRFSVLLHNMTESIAIDENTVAVPFGIAFG